MKNKFMLLVLFSFAIIACENIIDPHENGKGNPLKQKMEKMSDEMDKLMMTKDPDHDFAMMMKSHHKGAIDMANYELIHGDDDKLIGMAQMMKDMQQMEIAKLDSFMKAHTVMPDSMNGMAFMEASKMAMHKMDSLVKVQYLNKNTDHEFAVLMILHHKSAIEMAEAEIEYGKVEEMKKMATKMKEDQLEEIEKLEAWVENNY